MKQEEIDKQAKIEGERIYPGMTAHQQQQRDAFINGFCNGAKAIQLYSDQQNKELREENERLIAGIRRGQHLAENLKWSDDPNAEGFTANEKEIQRLTKEVEELKGKVKYRSFEEFFLNNHPDPDHLFAKTIEEAWPELCKLAQNFRGPEMGHKKRITLVWPDPKESGGFNEVTSGSVVELTDDAVVYLDKLKVWDENTRLRELLSRMAMTLEIYNTGADANILALLSEYNELNPKP